MSSAPAYRVRSPIKTGASRLRTSKSLHKPRNQPASPRTGSTCISHELNDCRVRSTSGLLCVVLGARRSSTPYTQQLWTCVSARIPGMRRSQKPLGGSSYIEALDSSQSTDLRA